MAVTIKAVAEAAGVSITTVSFVLNNKHPQVDAIPKATRDRVKACAEALGYRRNPAAAALRTGRSLWIGVVMQQLKDESDAWMWAPFELSLLSGVQKTLSERGYYTVLGSRPPGIKDDIESVETLISSGIGGLILRSPSSETVRRISEAGEGIVPTIAVFPLNRDDLYPYIIEVDNFRAGELAAELFIKAGRKAPMLVVNEECRYVEIDRINGFSAVIERKLGSSPYVCRIPNSYSDVARVVAMTDSLRANKPDCIMATEAGNAFLMSFAAEGLNLKVPEELAIIGFDCYSFRSAREQRISAVGTSWWQAGQLAASSILDMIENDTKWTEPKILGPKFIPGDTTPPELAEQGDLYWML